MKRVQKGISFTRLSIFYFITLVVIFAGLIFLSEKINQKFNTVQKSIETADQCEQASRIIKDISNDLSEKAYYFVMTHNSHYAEDYVIEKYKNLSRESAQKKISNLPGVTDATRMRLKIAMDQANNLGYTELYAMKLAFLAEGEMRMPDQIIMQKVRAVHISDDLDVQQKIAESVIFDQGYLDAKKRVNDNCLSIIDEIEHTIKVRLSSESRSLRKQIVVLNAIIGFLILMVSLFFMSIFNIVLIPLKDYIQSIKNKESLKLSGSTELRYLAQTYNEVHEYDALTKIFNRRAFNEICQKSEETGGSIGFLLVDLDNFKKINDSFGHSKGDYILQIAATLLSDMFKKEGDVARIGGDEFAVILSEGTKITPDLISIKIDTINRELNDIDGIEGASVSAGLAYSTKGYSKTLYENADKALYRTKENGKSSVSVWEEII